MIRALPGHRSAFLLTTLGAALPVLGGFAWVWSGNWRWEVTGALGLALLFLIAGWLYAGPAKAEPVPAVLRQAA